MKIVNGVVDINTNTVKEGQEEVIKNVVSMNGGIIGTIRKVIVEGFEKDLKPNKVAKSILKHFQKLNKESVDEAIDRIKKNIATKSPEVKDTYVEKVTTRLLTLLDGSEIADDADDTVVESATITNEEIEGVKIPKIVNIKKEEEAKKAEEKKVQETAEAKTPRKYRDTFTERTGISTFFSNLKFKIKTF